ncbi:hypothetical protein [Pseudomonas sp. C9-3]|uniref:hypothetical protein n=1 Tax=Pseudomonas sp. C9-3 TaxID=3078264 RepID=UPI0028EB7EC2|nr:hypothetical protein [Pseudomonas sp. C9-3]
MNSDRQSLLLLKGMVSDLPEEQQQEVFAVRDEIRAIARRGDVAVIGLSLALAEISVERESE